MAEDRLPNIHVRRASKGDLGILVQFNAAMVQETEGKTLELERLRAGVAAVLDDEGRGFYLVAEDLGRVVGQLLITTEWSDWRNAYFWWIQSVYVAHVYRRMGVYRNLHNHVMAESRTCSDVCGVRLYVDRDNRVAQQVYHSLEMRQSHYNMWEIDFAL